MLETAVVDHISHRGMFAVASPNTALHPRRRGAKLPPSAPLLFCRRHGRSLLISPQPAYAVPVRYTDLRVADMETFLTVCKLGSITSAARTHRVTASQVSKAVARIEAALDVELLVRTTRGVALLKAGHTIVPIFEDMLSKLDGLQHRGERVRELTIAGISYVVAFFATDIEQALAGQRLRCLAMVPAGLRGYAAEGVFDVALTIGREPLGVPWVETDLGATHSGLFGSPELVASLGGPNVSESAITEVPFISLIQIVNGRVAPAEDGCPLDRASRRIGHEVEMLGLGFDLASKTRQLVFGPRIAAAAFLGSGRLQEITVREWHERGEQRVFLYCNGQRVRKSTQKLLIASCTRALER